MMGVSSEAREEEHVSLSEILKEKLYFAPLPNVEDTSAVAKCLPKRTISFNIDSELVYEPFFADFGPLNLACTYRFCWKLHHLLKEADEQHQCVLYCCHVDPKKKSNAAVLLGAYLVLFCGAESDAAYATLSMFEPFLAFRDPTCGISTYRLTVLDCIRAVLKANQVGWIDVNNFNLEEYEYFEQVENGDLNWIVPNKLMAFSGPSANRLEIYGYRTLVPEDYIEYFHRVGITGVVRLNRKAYDRRRFTEHGLSHYDLYFPDGSCPPDRILRRFLEIVEDTSGALAVHCKAGLGRTGALMGCYIMKHYRFTCNETLGYLRIVRPGSVIGPQQHYLKEMQYRMWKAGSMLRHQVAQMTHNPRGAEQGPGSNSSGSCGTQPNNKFISSKRSLGSPSLRRGILRNRDEGGVVQDRAAERSPPSRSTLEVTTSPQRVRRKAIGTSRAGVYKGPMQNEASWGIRQQHAGVSPAAVNYTQSTGFSNIVNGMGRLSVNDPESSSSAKTFSRVHSQRCKGTINSTMSSTSPQNIGHGDNIGILRNITGHQPEAQSHGGSVIVQRVINSAGQPRKVLLPVAEKQGILPQLRLRFRDFSPTRRHGTPGRRVLGSTASKWDPAQSPYT